MQSSEAALTDRGIVLLVNAGNAKAKNPGYSPRIVQEFLLVRKAKRGPGEVFWR